MDLGNKFERERELRQFTDLSPEVPSLLEEANALKEMDRVRTSFSAQSVGRFLQTK
jgi:hypothetical protein